MHAFDDDGGDDDDEHDDDDDNDDDDDVWSRSCMTSLSPPCAARGGDKPVPHSLDYHIIISIVIIIIIIIIIIS